MALEWLDLQKPLTSLHEVVLMFRMIVRSIFNKFNWEVLKDGERQILEDGIEKHTQILRVVAFFLPFQIVLAVIAPEILTLLTICSFIALFLGGAWYCISFQNVSADQLEAGVADYITKRMYRSFLLAFSVLPVGMLVFMVRTLLPEIPSIAITEIPLEWRIMLVAGNMGWVVRVWVDVYQASTAYDASDSLLGDGFPTLMRGAAANARNLPMLEELRAITGLLKEVLGAREAGDDEHAST